MSGEADRFVVCRTTSGYLVEDGRQSSIPTHFEGNAIAIIREVRDDESMVYMIGRHEYFVLPNDFLEPIDPTKTGKGFDYKICNICHVLKSTSSFEVNQTDAKGEKTTRPSCRACRKDIDKRPMPVAAIKEANKGRPPKGSLWKCPICQKRSIVGVTAKVVLDHDHIEGNPRGFLCDSCNTGLGRFKNGGDYLRNAIAYLNEFNK